MKQNNLRRNLRIIGLAFSLVFGFIVITATSANAQNRNDRRNDDRTERRDDRDRTDRNRNNRNDDYDNNDRYDNNGRYDNNNGRYDNDRYNRNGYIVQQAYRAGMSQGIEDARDGRRCPLHHRRPACRHAHPPGRLATRMGDRRANPP